jgi:hypothetical protein
MKYLLGVLFIMVLVLSAAAISIEHVIKTSTAIYNQYDKEVGMQ